MLINKQVKYAIHLWIKKILSEGFQLKTDKVFFIFFFKFFFVLVDDVREDPITTESLQDLQ